jgi:putative glutamine amidotransferase
MSHKKQPIIRVGITANSIAQKDPDHPVVNRCSVAQDYITGVQAAGGVPWVLPITQDSQCIADYAQNCDCFIFTGGQDVHPKWFGAPAHPKLEAVLSARDAFEITLLRHCLSLHKPILGICRGMQVLNVALGGTLYQDLSLAPQPTVQHWQKAPPHEAIHDVTLAPGSRLHAVFQTDILPVNSYHHQALHTLAPDLLATAHSADGLIEGVEHRSLAYVLGVQWHPEMMQHPGSPMPLLFRWLIGTAQQLSNPQDPIAHEKPS